MPALADLLPVAAVHVFGNVGPVLCAIFLNKIKDLQRTWHHWWAHVHISWHLMWCHWVHLLKNCTAVNLEAFLLFPSDTFWSSYCIFLLHYIYLITLVTLLDIFEFTVLKVKQKHTNRENKMLNLKVDQTVFLSNWIWILNLISWIKKNKIWEIFHLWDKSTSIFCSIFQLQISFFFYSSYIEQFTAVFECSSTFWSSSVVQGPLISSWLRICFHLCWPWDRQHWQPSPSSPSLTISTDTKYSLFKGYWSNLIGRPYKCHQNTRSEQIWHIPSQLCVDINSRNPVEDWQRQLEICRILTETTVDL